MNWTKTTELLSLRLESVGGYIREHSVRVAGYAKTTEERNVAFAHDLLEDHHATYEELVGFGMNTTELAAMMYITKDDSEDYEDYIDDIVNGVRDSGPAAVLAARVKIYDLFDHLHPHNLAKRSQQGNQRYLDALTKITHALRDYETAYVVQGVLASPS